MTKPASNWATRTKEVLATTKASVPAGMKVVSGGSSDPIIAFYRFTEPKTPSPLARILNKGDVFEGTYDGSFESKNYAGQYTHKVRTAEGLIALPGAAQLNNGLSKVPKGAQVQVVYNGKTTIETGKFAGKQAHSFQVASDSQIENAPE